MAKRSQKPIDIEKHWRSGAGQGTGSAYIPWLRVQSFSSLGDSNRTKGWKTGRRHEFMSDLENYYFYLLEWSPIVIDIREQYPLLPLISTKEVADHLGVKPPTIPNTSEMSVMTTDFLITVVQDGEQRELARSIKYAKELEKPRVVEKLEIERLWWEARGVEWGIVTERDIPMDFVKNVQEFHTFRDLEGYPQLQRDTTELVRYLTDKLQKSSSPLSQITNACDAEIGLETGSFLALAKHLISTRRWVIDMEKEFMPTRQLELLAVNLEE
jgi:hypothetical protein